jgi:hypothetical protein
MELCVLRSHRHSATAEAKKWSFFRLPYATGGPQRVEVESAPDIKVVHAGRVGGRTTACEVARPPEHVHVAGGAVVQAWLAGAPRMWPQGVVARRGVALGRWVQLRGTGLPGAVAGPPGA